VQLEVWKIHVQGETMPRGRLVKELTDARDRDPGNPELHFWLGRAHASAGDLPRAEEALLRAWSLGKKDPGTLFLAIGVNARGNERAALDRLRTLWREITPNCALHVLEARLLHALGDTKGACDALDRAASRCTTPSDRETLERVRRELGCT
jgi:hypothetical protein